MTLRLTLAALLAFSLACASGGKTTAVGGEETTTPPPPPPQQDPPKQPEVNLAKKAFEDAAKAAKDAEEATADGAGTAGTAGAADGAGTAGAADGAGTADAADGGDAEADGTAGEDAPVEYETASVKTLLKAPPTERTKMRKSADGALLEEAKKMGYTSVTNVKMGKLSCDDAWCTAPVTGTARRVKKTDEAAGGAGN